MNQQINYRRFLKSTLASVIASASSFSLADFAAVGTDYTDASQRYHVWNQALSPIDLVNSILCFTEQMKFNHFINQGSYLALVDESACFENTGNENAAATQSSGWPILRFMQKLLSIHRANL